MLRKLTYLGILLGVVVCLTGVTARSASAQEISIRVIEVRASNSGGEYVDPSLGVLGERLKNRYPYKNYRKLATTYRSGKVGSSITCVLTGGMTLTVTLTGYADPAVSMRVVVTEGSTQVVSADTRVNLDRTFIISVPLGGDVLILAIKPSLK